MTVDGVLESALRRDRWIVLFLLAVVAGASWAYLLAGAGMGMSAIGISRTSGIAEMAGIANSPEPWSPGHSAIVFVMWWVMMVAMMLPSATPMILLFAVVNRRQQHERSPHVPTGLFAASYLVAWGGFSILAVGLHWLLQQLGLFSAGMMVTSQLLGAGILIGAGLYQLTPMKQACLRHCRMPAAYLAEHWRPGRGAAFQMGLWHGAYCLGCCWFLMLLLFFGGVMNLFWIAGLALYVLVEKVLPPGNWLERAIAIMLIGAGGWLLATA